MLAVAIRPLAAAQTAEALVMLLPLLTRHPDAAFNDETLRAVASADEPISFRLIDKTLTAWTARQPRPDRPALTVTVADPFRVREEALKREWDDADGIARLAAAICAERSPFRDPLLRTLTAIVRRYAPHHVHILHDDRSRTLRLRYDHAYREV